MASKAQEESRHVEVGVRRPRSEDRHPFQRRANRSCRPPHLSPDRLVLLIIISPVHQAWTGQQEHLSSNHHDYLSPYIYSAYAPHSWMKAVTMCWYRHCPMFDSRSKNQDCAQVGKKRCTKIPYTQLWCRISSSKRARLMALRQQRSSPFVIPRLKIVSYLVLLHVESKEWSTKLLVRPRCPMNQSSAFDDVHIMYPSCDIAEIAAMTSTYQQNSVHLH